MGMVAADRVFKVLDTKSNIQDHGQDTIQNIKGDLEFSKVKFSYVKNEKVLKGISFKIAAGDTLAIVGSTGAGKSTIVNLLNRLYDIDSGKITIDSIDIKTLALKSLRQNIAVVLQDVFLFADTILNNITLNNSAISELDVQSAAKDIGVHNFIMSLPGGYHYNVKERGVMLSSGQRQLISFLRAYVTNPKILILDEATASIDSHSEQMLQKATQKITHGRTSIVIAHRLATIKKSDMIIVLEAGEIVETGTHKELLSIKNGWYRNLYDAQFLSDQTQLKTNQS
jgi:subfamily B ATP-binding cassette protein MsbA